MARHLLGLSALISGLVLAACNAISGIDSLTFDGVGASGGGGSPPGVGGGGSGGDGGEAGGGAGGGAGGEAGGEAGGGAGGEAGGGGTGGEAGGGECDGELCPTPTGVDVVDQGDTEVRGNRGTAMPAMERCPGRQVIVGFRGTLGTLGESYIHGKIQAQCGHLELTGDGSTTITTTPGDVTALQGAYGSESWDILCPDNEVAVGFSVWAGSYVDALFIACAPLRVTGPPGDLRVEIGPVTWPDGVGGDGGSELPDTFCGTDQIANRFQTVSANGPIAAFGLGCATPSLTY
ncbi:hypothetical protein WMF18_04645 [Sorangium sp. So ce315]|uniref:hypothetical protein n=1 Tax=Sorangium sp. So ce315 TaxID=3133299 RepID=UPI003F631273